MILYIILAFTLLPVLELSLLIHLAARTSWQATVLLILLTGVIGGGLAKHQGWKAWGEIKLAVGEGRIPGNELMHGFLILISGALLLTPGILTDIVGFLLLVPAFRGTVGSRILRRLTVGLFANAENHPHFQFHGTNGTNGTDGTTADRRTDGDDIIDVDAKVETDND